MQQPSENTFVRSQRSAASASETDAETRLALRAQGRNPLQARLRLVLIGLGISVVPLDTAVNIAFPDITGSFHQPIAMIQWVVICYVLTHAGLMLALGRAGDMWSYGRVFRAGLAWSVVAFLLCAAAPSFGWLLFFRFLQGIGAGLIISCAPALVTGLYPETRRSHAIGVFTLIYSLGSAMGPLIGGALVARWGWASVFWFRAPIALTSLLFLTGLPRLTEARRDERFDIVGAVLLAAGLSGLLLAINALPRLRDGDLLAVFLFPAAVISLAAFAWWETRTPHPIVRVELFRNVGFSIINLSSCLMYLVTFSVMLIGPFFIKPLIISRYGDYWGGFTSGLVLGAGFIAMSLASPLAAPLVTRLGAVRVASLGGLMIGLGLVLVGRWQPQTPTIAMVSVLALQGIGTAFFQVSYMELVLATAPLAHRGVAGSLSMLTRTIGTVTGAASLMLGFQTIAAAARAAGVDPQQAFLTAFHTMFLVAGCVAIATGGLVALAVRRKVPPAAETEPPI